MSKLTDFLLHDYIPYHKLVWDSATMTIRAEYPTSAQFEIEDKKPQIIQTDGKGVAVFRQGIQQINIQTPKNEATGKVATRICNENACA